MQSQQLCAHKDGGAGAHSVFLLHHLMAGVVLLKMVSVLFLSLDFHFQNIVGHPGGWTVAFYVVNFIKVRMRCRRASCTP